MSEYGWLAESTVIPQKASRKIEVDDSSVKKKSNSNELKSYCC